MEYKSEAHLQSLCTKWFRKEYPEQWYRLFLIFNNPPNGAMASLLKSMGLQKGVSDQLYFTPGLKLHWIEYKIDNRRQSEDQKEFEKLVTEYGCGYSVIRNEDEFILLIKKLN